MKQKIQQILYPIRKLAAKFAKVDEIPFKDTIVYKAAHIHTSGLVEGDYLEFGVYTGRSFIRSYNILKNVFDNQQQKQQRVSGEGKSEHAVQIGKIWENMRFFAFDSFQGLPEPEGFDKVTKDFVEGKYAYPEDKFRDKLLRAGIPLDKVVINAGWFEETCTEETIKKHDMRKASLIYIDCDLYESAKVVLDFVKPLLTDGTIIVFDDYYFFRGNPNLGEQRAFREWKETMTDWIFTEYQKEGTSRNSFIASKRNLNQIAY